MHPDEIRGNKVTPMNIEFQNLKRNRAFCQLLDDLGAMIQKAKDEFFRLETGEDEGEQKMRIRHYDEFLKKMKTIVANNCAKN